VYLALHKPAGVVTTRRDPEGRPTVHDLLPPGLGHVFAVGRLDKDSAGLLLLTSDTRWAEGIAAPGGQVEKTYRAELDRPLSQAEADLLAAGIELAGSRTLPCRVQPVAGRPRAADLVLREGRNRQVRRMLAAVGREVRALTRIRIGTLELGALAPGASRPLTAAEVAALAAPIEGPGRGRGRLRGKG
jgi:23S rRNA pseudouridine2605 synthase